MSGIQGSDNTSPTVLCDGSNDYDYCQVLKKESRTKVSQILISLSLKTWVCFKALNLNEDVAKVFK